MYDKQFIKSCEENQILRTVNGTTPGASSVNIPGAKTWAGNNIKNSETELIVPSIVVKGISSKEVFESIELQGVYEI